MARIKYKEAIRLEVRRGRPSAGQAPSKAALVRLYVNEGRSIRNVADVLGTTKDAVYRGLKANGIKARSNVRRSKLRTIPLRDLAAGIKAKGIRGLARDLGIDEGTVRHHMKARKDGA